jgi:hypothetical protein
MPKTWRETEPVFAVVNDHGYVCLSSFGPQPAHVALWVTRKDAEKFAECMRLSNNASYTVVEMRITEVTGD